MKIFAKFGPGILIPVLCVALGIAGAVMAPSCATVQKIATSAGNPDSAVGAIVADCAKPEIANQAANILADINAIAVDPSKAVQVKNDEIDALKKAGQEALVCALRAGITDLTTMITGAVQVHAKIDPRILSARSILAGNVFSHGYTYTDGWTATPYVGGAGGASGSARGAGGAGGAGGASPNAGGQ